MDYHKLLELLQAKEPLTPQIQAAIQNYQRIQELTLNWTPHEKQVEIGVALFDRDIRSIFVECGRKFGKTELVIYILWRWAQTYPDSKCYYIAPLLNQAREIVWSDPRLQNFGPRDWLLPGSEGINNTEMRLKFKNGSFIKIDGSDNWEKHRGTRPSILIHEEHAQHRKEFREVMRPNLSVFNAPEIFIGTPPEDRGDESNNEYLMRAEEHKNDSAKAYFHAPSSANPHISKAWLADEKKRLYARGEGHIWMREYEAIYVKGGSHKIFPMLTKDLVINHDEVMQSIKKDLRKLEWFCITDPAGATCFAVLYGAINPYNRKIYLLDEIYEQKQEEMTVKKIGPRMEATWLELSPRSEWRKIYDEAETWFANEMLAELGIGFEPTTKSKSDKISGLSQIKDIIAQGNLLISSRCEKLFWEMDRYCKDQSGKIPKKDDHLIDCLRYMLEAAHYTSIEEIEKIETQDEMFRGARIQDDFHNLTENGMIDDWGLE